VAKILIIDDDTGFPMALQAALRNQGHTVEIATDVEAGLAVAKKREDFEVVLTDLYFGVLDPQGLDLIAQLRQARPQLPVIAITCKPETGTTIEATKRGAFDYVTKPTNEAEMGALLNVIERAVTSQRMNGEPAKRREKSYGNGAIVGMSRAMQKVYTQIGRVAAKPVTVLVRGETGTGKELVAHALHQHSARKKQPFIIVNCVAIPESLLESELFGHEQGACTGATSQRLGRFEQANGGTIFLDEIGDMNLGIQAKLLRVLQDKTIHRVGGKLSFQVDVRVIAATHLDLEQAVAGKKFRQDLYYRLNDAVVRLPPLRERKEDIPELVYFFIQQHAAELDAVGSTIDKEAIQYLQDQPWHGNVRELRNVVRKALLVARGHRIDVHIIAKLLDETRIFRRPPAPADAGQSLPAYVSQLLDSAEQGECEDVAGRIVEWAEREIYGQAIRLAEGDQSRASRWLGVSRPTLREKLSRYDLRPVMELA